MSEIDKDKFKTYINEKYVESIRVDDIESITIKSVRYYDLSEDSIYNDVIKRDGFVDLLMIKPIWSGWKLVIGPTARFAGTWAYLNSRSGNRFNLETYQKWLVDVRDRKLESILE